MAIFLRHEGRPWRMCTWQLANIISPFLAHETILISFDWPQKRHATRILTQTCIFYNMIINIMVFVVVTVKLPQNFTERNKLHLCINLNCSRS